MFKLPLSPKASLTVIACAVAVTVGVVIAPVGASAAVSYVLLGRSNYAATQTNISNSAGTPLGLNAKSGYAPLYVNSTKQVARLNADYVDGYHASSFAKITGKTGVILGIEADGAAKCPAGTVLTGGGGLAEGGLGYSGPDFDTSGNPIPNSWLAISLGADTAFSFAVCYSPTGAVPGALSGAALAKMTSALKPSALKTALAPTPTASGTATTSPSPTIPTSPAVVPPGGKG